MPHPSALRMSWSSLFSPAPVGPVQSTSALTVDAAASAASGSTEETLTRTGGANTGVAGRPGTDAAKTARAHLDWADLLRRTFAIDILLCTRCGGNRRV